jgi:hypothetical protein
MCTKTIGVIAKNVESFLAWKIKNSLNVDSNSKNIKRKFSHNGVIYMAITKLNDLCSQMFDEIIELEDAKYTNREYSKIKEVLNIHIKKHNKIIKGKLEFISMFHPIRVKTKSEEIDLRKDIFKLFLDINDKPTTMMNTMNSIEIFVDDKSEYRMKFEMDNVKETILMLLSKAPEFGFSNLNAYIPNMLERLNGMEIIVTIDDNSIRIENDPLEKVYELNYTHDNSCSIPEDKVKEICKIGETDCCIFLTVSGNGFECQKFNNTSRMLLDRYSRGTMRASRIGNCKIVGRIESKIE